MQTWQDVVSEFPAEVAARILPPGLKGEGERATAAGAADLPADLTAAERAVLKLIPADAPAHIDALAEASGLAASELAAALLGLELRELVRPLPGKCFVRKM